MQFKIQTALLKKVNAALKQEMEDPTEFPMTESIMILEQIRHEMENTFNNVQHTDMRARKDLDGVLTELENIPVGMEWHDAFVHEAHLARGLLLLQYEAKFKLIREMRVSLDNIENAIHMAKYLQMHDERNRGKVHMRGDARRSFYRTFLEVFKKLPV
jgi:hypothetical protein